MVAIAIIVLRGNKSKEKALCLLKEMIKVRIEGKGREGRRVSQLELCYRLA
jgi:hypothetical protein